MKAWMLAVLMLGAVPALAAEPTPEELLRRYDEAMGPRTFEAESQMTAWREDGGSRTYELRMLKGEDDKSRIWFKSPANVKGQEILRVGDNLWVYLPNLKRAMRVANRDNFQGGDFNNADILRVSYSKDYTAKQVPSDVPDTWALELKAKSPETAYDAIKLWLRKPDGLPVKGQYFGTSGQMLRSAEFSDFIELEKGYTRPVKVVMRNELVKNRRSELVVKSLKRGVDAPPQRFTQSDLGR
jgi:outer membrane lipoprotein-sorting protein